MGGRFRDFNGFSSFEAELWFTVPAYSLYLVWVRDSFMIFCKPSLIFLFGDDFLAGDVLLFIGGNK
jgi:hypothetical protein